MNSCAEKDLFELPNTYCIMTTIGDVLLWFMSAPRPQLLDLVILVGVGVSPEAQAKLTS